MNNAAIIYALCEPDGTTIRYVGKTSPGREAKRFKRHLFDKVIHPTRKTNWIAKLKREGERPVMITLAVVPKAEWEYWEIRFIRELRKSFDLTNSDEGGRDPGKRSDEVRARISAARSTPEMKARISGANHFFKHNPEAVANHAAAVSTEEYREQFRGENNPMSNADVRAKQLEAVNRPEQRALRRDNMNKLHADAEFRTAHAKRLHDRALVIAKGDLLFGGADAACKYFGISRPTLVKHLASGAHGFTNAGTVGGVEGAINGGFARAGVWYPTTPSDVEKLQHGNHGKPSNFKGRGVTSTHP